MFEAGTRVPFAVFWKGKIEPIVSDAIICQMDLTASIAKLLRLEIEASDSEELLDVLMGTSAKGRNELILEATTKTALRKGDWILIPPYKGPAINEKVNIELGNAKEFQLFNLADDPGQKNNLAQENKEKLEEMIASFQAIRGTGYDDVEQLELK